MRNMWSLYLLSGQGSAPLCYCPPTGDKLQLLSLGYTYLLPHPHMVEGARDLSRVSFIKALIPFRRLEPKAPTSKYYQHMNFVGTYSDHYTGLVQYSFNRTLCHISLFNWFPMPLPDLSSPLAFIEAFCCRKKKGHKRRVMSQVLSESVGLAAK